MFDLKFIKKYISVFNMLKQLQNRKRVFVEGNQANQILNKNIAKPSAYYYDGEDVLRNYQFDLLKYFDLYQSFIYYHARLYDTSNHHLF